MEDPYEWMMEPKKWLILTLLAHTGLGVIGNANAHEEIGRASCRERV